MAATISSFVDGVFQSELLDHEQRDEVRRLQGNSRDLKELAYEILHRDWLTAFQINQILQGKGNGLTLGPFVLLERVGEGGMGQVFKARQKMLNRIVALKVIRKQCLGNPKITLRFLREIRAAGQLSHPHIVRAYDADQVDGLYYISMEFIEGIDLAKLVRDSGPLPIDQACEYIRQAALGLQHAFERGMVHRDIKPANLLVTRAVASDRRRSSGMIPRPTNLPPLVTEATSGKANLKRTMNALPRLADTQQYPWGVVKILDMGLARCTDPFTGQTATHLTQIGSVVGTPEYIAPEQARDSHTSDIRADLYSLGCTLYYLLSGQPPFPHGTLTEKLLQHQLEEPKLVTEARRDRVFASQVPVSAASLHVPEPVVELVHRLLAKRPEDRHQTPIELANELQTILQQLADGTLPKEPTGSATLTDSVIVNVELAAASTADIVPLVQLTPKPVSANRWMGKIVLGLASVGGLTFILMVTVVAAMLSRGGHTQAGGAEPEPSVKPMASDDAVWKRSLRIAVQKRAGWDEARHEMLRYRASAASAAQVRLIDDLLPRLPTPFDALDRSGFGVPLPPGMPAEVIGMYGFAGANVNKPVTSVAVSANGRWLVTNEDNGIRLFDVRGSVIPYKIQAHKTRVNQVALSPDGRLVASAGEDGTVRIWDVLTRNAVHAFDRHRKPVTRIAFSPDGALIASAGKDGTIRLWEARTGTETRRFDSNDADVRVLAFANDGRQIFWGGTGQEIRWVGVKPGAASGKFDARFAGQRVLAFQPHGNLVVVGGGQGLQVLAWDGKNLVQKAALKEQQQVNQVAFAPDGKSFVAVGLDPSVTFWDAQTLKLQKTWNTLRTPGHSAVFSPDGRHLVIGAAHNQAFVVRLATHDFDTLKSAIDW